MGSVLESELAPIQDLLPLPPAVALSFIRSQISSAQKDAIRVTFSPVITELLRQLTLSFKSSLTFQAAPGLLIYCLIIFEVTDTVEFVIGR